jgi:hypothetical protein
MDRTFQFHPEMRRNAMVKNEVKEQSENQADNLKNALAVATSFESRARATLSPKFEWEHV